MTSEEREQGATEVMRLMVEAGATPRQMRSYFEALDTADDADDVEQEHRMAALPTFDELLARGGATVVLEREPVITDLPVPGEFHDPKEALAGMFLESRGVRTELPAHGGLPIPDLDPGRTPIVQEWASGLPIPGDTIQQSAQLMMEPMQPSRPLAVRINQEASGEVAFGLPLPKL